MSTNSAIAVKTFEGYKTIYCHWDGYPSYMYPLLRDYYGSQERAESLIALGDASSLDKRLVPSVGSNHSFCEPEDGVCVFYHRDRGDPSTDCAPAIMTKGEVLKLQYYAYIFEDGQWKAYQDGVEVDSYEY